MLGPPHVGELPSGAGQGDSDLQLTSLRIPDETSSVCFAGGDAGKDGKNPQEETGPAEDLPVPSEGKDASGRRIVSPPQPVGLLQTVNADHASERPVGSCSFTTGLVPLFSFLAGLPFCLLVLVVTLLFILRQYGRRHGLVFRVELVNAQGTGRTLQRQDHFQNSSPSEATDPTQAKKKREL